VLCAYAWPGNVRELRNTLERAVLFSESARIDARSLVRFIGDGQGEAMAQGSGANVNLPDAVSEGTEVSSYSDAMREFERRFLSDALRAAGGHVAQAAARIGMARATLYRRIVALGIEV
jgi:DNA-binding NtrC family response regulator